MKAVTADEMRSIERAAVVKGFSLDTLMKRAGLAVAEAVAESAPDAPIVVLVGPGNNGGDGLVAAQRLRERGWDVTAYLLRQRDLVGYTGPVADTADDPDLQYLRSLLSNAGSVVDALLGIGQSRAPEGALEEILTAVSATRRHSRVDVAVDIPTGVDTDTGAVVGKAFCADMTVCVGFLKVGDVVYPGAGYAGDVQLAPAGIPRELAHDVRLSVPSATDVARNLPRRPLNSNKGTYGRVLAVAGSAEFLGAAGLCSIAALRAGAGLAEIATVRAARASVAAHALEPVYVAVPEEHGCISPRAEPEIQRALEAASAAVFGPGLGLTDGTVELTRSFLRLRSGSAIPTVIDADGLNALARIPEWWESVTHTVLTPHPGEMSRLTGLSIAQIQADRLAVARRFAAQWGNVVVLKGAGTIVALPSGEASVNPTGGPNLATGGTGDVLSGIIGGLMAQQCPPDEAALAGVFLHGFAGDMAAENSGDAGTLAGDLLPLIPRARSRILDEGANEQ